MFESDFDASDIAATVNGIGTTELELARQAIPRFLDEMSWEAFTPRLGAVYDALLADAGGSNRL